MVLLRVIYVSTGIKGIPEGRREGDGSMEYESKRADDSLETVLARYADMVYRLAFSRTLNRADADDILQEVFLRYIRYAGDFSDEAHRKAWLLRVTLHCSTSLLRSAWRRHTTALSDTLCCHMQEKSQVYYAVMALPCKYRTIIHLYYYEELSVKEIGQMLNLNESTVKSRLHRGRGLLRENLKEGYDDV